jgi:hypothetical protein
MNPVAPVTTTVMSLWDGGRRTGVTARCGARHRASSHFIALIDVAATASGSPSHPHRGSARAGRGRAPGGVIADMFNALRSWYACRP